MGKKSKSSRKGKKAWRANISTEDVEDYLEKSTKDVLCGESIANATSESLFVVDKCIDLSAKRKIEKRREKVLHCDSLLQRNAFVQPIPSSKRKKSSKQLKKVQIATNSLDCSKDGASDSTVVDSWNEKGVDGQTTKRILNPSIIPAVEVEPPGCSFNPCFESHQDSLAVAVADEMQKIYQDELGPEPVPLIVPGEIVEDEDKYFLEVGNDSDNDDPIQDHDNDDLNVEKGPLRSKRVTRVEQNKRARLKERSRKETESKQLENLSKQIDSLPDIIQEIEKEEEEKQKRQMRRIVARQDRRKSGPPRLGKYKFEPASQQVLLSDEITGSLRKLKGCCTLARDRYKSLEKRGLVAPSARTGRK